MTEDEMVGWHHRLEGREFEQTWEDSEGQGRLACCSPWGHKESDTTERLNNLTTTTGALIPNQKQNFVQVVICLKFKGNQ